MIRLEFPNESHREMFEDMRNLWKDYEVPRVSGRIFKYKNFDEFLASKRQDVQWRPWLVPATYFFSILDDKIIGHIQIRHHIDHPNLQDVGGHIGYGIVPWMWNKWYWKGQLRLALDESRKLGLEKVMVSSVNDNPASTKVIEANGGILTHERIPENRPKDMEEESGKILKTYWITL